MTAAPPDRLTLDRIDSPIGPLDLAFDPEGRLRGLSFDTAEAPAGNLTRAMRREYPSAGLESGAAPKGVVTVLRDYFDGEPTALERIDWSLEGARSSDGFQAKVWRALTGIPAGRTVSYGEMARRVGEADGLHASAAQAAGVALNRNPIALVLACHRVVGADGSMTGFGGGLERKTRLLRHEGALLI